MKSADYRGKFSEFVRNEFVQSDINIENILA